MPLLSKQQQSFPQRSLLSPQKQTLWLECKLWHTLEAAPPKLLMTLIKLIHNRWTAVCSLTIGFLLDRTCLSHRPAVYFVTLDTGLAALYSTSSLWYFMVCSYETDIIKAFYLLLSKATVAVQIPKWHRCYENWLTDVIRIQSFWFWPRIIEIPDNSVWVSFHRCVQCTQLFCIHFVRKRQ